MITKTIFEIVVTTEKELSAEEKQEIMYNFHSRLEGYHTKCPECIKNNDVLTIRLKKE